MSYVKKCCFVFSGKKFAVFSYDVVINIPNFARSDKNGQKSEEILIDL